METTIKKTVDFFPRTDAELAIWLTVYKEGISVVGAVLGMLPSTITEQEDGGQSLIDAISRVAIKRNELADAVEAKENIKATVSQLIRNEAGIIKRNAAYTSDIGKRLGIVASSQLVDTTTLRPDLKLTPYPGYVSVGFTKQGSQSIHIYSRLQGTTNWEKIAVVKTSPYMDVRPLKEVNKPEVREYAAICSNGNREIGQMSPMLSVVFGGDSGSITQ